MSAGTNYAGFWITVNDARQFFADETGTDDSPQATTSVTIQVKGYKKRHGIGKGIGRREECGIAVNADETGTLHRQRQQLQFRYSRAGSDTTGINRGLLGVYGAGMRQRRVGITVKDMRQFFSDEAGTDNSPQATTAVTIATGIGVSFRTCSEMWITCWNRKRQG